MAAQYGCASEVIAFYWMRWEEGQHEIFSYAERGAAKLPGGGQAASESWASQ
jgi:hypothetical protein